MDREKLFGAHELVVECDFWKKADEGSCLKRACGMLEDGDGAGGSLDESDKDFDAGGFTGPVGACKSVDLSLRYVECEFS